uniref:Pectolytic enzyme, Pectin lyase fold n=1 Tax=Medicago truncatula TaxID=3880 RepID=A2Q437_MEDTR|nr:Pectolytic enzyme, Pectin lyase fold [Medicago truncatula]
MDIGICTFVLLLLMASSSRSQSVVLDVTKHATISVGEITEALIATWKEACASTSSSKILIPKGTYKLKQVNLRGPCNAPIEIQVDGTIEAPADLTQLDGKYQWIIFGYFDFFTLSGVGTFDGLGEVAWKQNGCGKNKNCNMLSMNFGFYFLNNSIIKGITSKDSKYFHVNVFGCKNLTFMDFSATAPATSPNRDGSKQITILNVTCGPGHGISVGSLGKYSNEEPLEYITVRNCTLRNTDNGLRIKTWPTTPITYDLVSNLHFENIIMDNVSNPVIIIDQE